MGRLNHFVASTSNDDEDEENKQEDPLGLNDCISRLGTPKLTEPLDILIGVLVSCCEHDGVEDDVESMCETLDDLTADVIKRDDAVDWKFNSKMTYVFSLCACVCVRISDPQSNSGTHKACRKENETYFEHNFLLAF